jgi:uncharacterized protein (DUF849 family)
MTNKKFIFNFAPTGMIPTKASNPAVPLTPDEIVEQVLEAAACGVNMVHLHARDPSDGMPTYRKEIYGEIIAGIRKENRRLILCVSTSGRNFNELEKRADPLKLDGDLTPDFASLTLSSLNFNQQASVNTPEVIQALAARMAERGIRPELEVFDLGMINYARYLIKKNVIRAPYYFNLILGNIASAQANLLSLGLLINELPQGSVFSAGGIGSSQLRMNVFGILAGGGVRVGLEDNLWLDEERRTLATNLELVRRVASTARQLGYQPYDVEEARALLGLR